MNDVKRYFEIYGNNQGSVKGKTTRKKPEEVTTENLVDVPSAVLRYYRVVSLCADLFYIKPFLT